MERLHGTVLAWHAALADLGMSTGCHDGGGAHITVVLVGHLDSPRGTRVKSEQPSYTGSEESDARHWRGGRAPDLEQEGPRVPEALGVTGWE